MLSKLSVFWILYLGWAVIVEAWWPFTGRSERTMSPGKLLTCKGKKECAQVIKELGSRARRSNDALEIVRKDDQIVAAIQARIQLGDVRGAIALLKPSEVCDMIDFDLLNKPREIKQEDQKYWDFICKSCNKGKVTPIFEQVCKGDSPKDAPDVSEESEYRDMLQKALKMRRQMMEEDASVTDDFEYVGGSMAEQPSKNYKSVPDAKELDFGSVANTLGGKIEELKRKEMLPKDSQAEEPTDASDHSSNQEWD